MHKHKSVQHNGSSCLDDIFREIELCLPLVIHTSILDHYSVVFLRKRNQDAKIIQCNEVWAMWGSTWLHYRELELCLPLVIHPSILDHYSVDLQIVLPNPNKKKKIQKKRNSLYNLQ